MLLSLVLALSPMADAAAEPQRACSQAVVTYAGETSLVLAEGYGACLAEMRSGDAAFLLMLTKVRFATDMVIYQPEDAVSMLDDAQFVSAYALGSRFVDETLARDMGRSTRSWRGCATRTFPYHPATVPAGRSLRGSKQALYDAVANGTRTDQLASEEYVARLVRDDAYFAAYLERKAIIAALAEDGALPDGYHTLAGIMAARKAIVGDPPEGSAVPWSEVYRPGPDAGFETLAVGFDGPAKGGSEIFESAGAVAQSWVGPVLGKAQLAHVLADVDFTQNVVGVYAIGEMQNATGNTIATHFEANREYGGYAFGVAVGVVGADCATVRTRSYPFVVAKTARGSGTQITASSRGNFPDQC